MLGIALALGSSVAWGISDFLGGLQTRRASALAVLLVTQPVGLVLALAVALAFGGDRLSAAEVATALGAGALAVLALGAFYRAMALGSVSVVATIGALGVVVPVARGYRPRRGARRPSGRLEGRSPSPGRAGGARARFRVALGERSRRRPRGARGARLRHILLVPGPRLAAQPGLDDRRRARRRGHAPGHRRGLHPPPAAARSQAPAGAGGDRRLRRARQLALRPRHQPWAPLTGLGRRLDVRGRHRAARPVRARRAPRRPPSAPDSCWQSPASGRSRREPSGETGRGAAPLLAHRGALGAPVPPIDHSAWGSRSAPPSLPCCSLLGYASFTPRSSSRRARVSPASRWSTPVIPTASAPAMFSRRSSTKTQSAGSTPRRSHASR